MPERGPPSEMTASRARGVSATEGDGEWRERRTGDDVLVEGGRDLAREGAQVVDAICETRCQCMESERGGGKARELN